VALYPQGDMPEQNWQPQSSFQAPIAPILVDPGAGTQVCAPKFAREWLPFIEGCLDQGRIPATFAYIDDATVELMRSYVDKLKSILSMAAPCCDLTLRLQPNCVLQYSLDGGATWVDVSGWADNFATCVSNVIIPPVPPWPGPPNNPSEACAIAEFLSTELIQGALQQAINSFNANQQLVNYILDILPIFSWAFPITTFGLEAFVFLYSQINAGNVANFTAAMSDPLLWADVVCAIYDAIVGTGYVTPANKPQICTNIAAIIYPHPEIITAISGFCNAITITQLQAFQNVGIYGSTAGCTGCVGNWCHGWDFSAANPTPVWHIGNRGLYDAGRGFEAGNYGGAGTLLNFESDFPPTTVSHFTINWRTDKVSGGDARAVYFYRAGVLITSRALNSGVTGGIITEDFDLCPGFACDRIQVEIDSTASDATTWCSGVQVNGRDGSPYGDNNCALLPCV
jgi:hypothetical protein